MAAQLSDLTQRKVSYQLTKNTSFLQMHQYLKEKGIKNNKFFLALYDEGLRFVDPRAEGLSTEIKARIITECKINPWYYFREVVRIPVPGGSIPYNLHRGNLALTYMSLHNIDTITLMPRQHGKTIGAVSLFSWLFFFGTKNTQSTFMNKKYGDAQVNLKRFKNIVELIPAWMIEPKQSREDQESSTTFSRNKLLKNIITAMPAATSPEEADKLGRGLTMPCWFFDEIAFAKYNNIIYAAAAPAVSQAAIEAEKNGVPHFKMFTTTPNSIDTDEGGWAKHNLIEAACDFTEEMYDVPADKLRDYVYERSTNNFVHIEFTWRELGRDEKWYEQQCRDLQYDRQKIKREVDLEWTLSSDKSPFTEDCLERVSNFVVRKEQETYLRIGDQGNHKFTMLEPVDFHDPVILSVDVGGGVGTDFSVIHMLDIDDFHEKGYFSSNRINPIPFARILIEVVRNLFYNSLLVVERNSYGLDVITTLLESSVTANKVFYRTINNPIPGQGNKVQKVYGIDTTSGSRDIMIANLFMYVEEEPHTIRSRFTYEELKTLERKSNGKVEHSNGAHDDFLMSMLIGRYAASFDSFKMFKRRVCASSLRERKSVAVPEEKMTTITEHIISSEENVVHDDLKMRKIFSLNFGNEPNFSMKTMKDTFYGQVQRFNDRYRRS